MRRTLILLAWVILCWSVSSSVRAQPPHPHGPHPEPKPPATVVARVNVNVETNVDVAHGPAAAGDEEEDEEDEEEGDEGDEKPELSDLVASILEQAGGRSGVVVIADVNVNVKTSIKVRSQSTKSSATAKASGVSATQKAESRSEDPKPAAESAAPHRKKKHFRKQNKQPAEEKTAAAAQPEDSLAGISLNRLKIGDRLELGVSSQLASEQRAQQIADQINLGRNRTLLGIALACGFLPDQSESLGVVQKAVASVNAQSTGSELSVSVAIPKETSSAIRTLIEAAMRQ